MDDREFEAMWAAMSMVERSRRLASDPAFAEAFRKQREKTAAAEPVSPSSDVNTDRVWSAARNGRDHCFTKLFPGVPRVVRAVGDLLVVTRHWGRSRGAICIKAGGDCPLCPDPAKRREGYFDAIATRKLRDRTEAFRIVQHIPQAGLDAMGGVDGMAIRGWAIKLLLPREKAATRVEILETECVEDLPDPIDVRDPLMRFWNLDHWPVPASAATEEPSILRFRKQA